MKPQDFEGMVASVIPSFDQEVTLGKQPVLSEYGREVRTALNAMPPDVSKSLMASYGEPSQQVVNSMQDAIILRELAIENASQENNLDQEWLNSGGGKRSIDERNVGNDDEWNIPGM